MEIKTYQKTEAGVVRREFVYKDGNPDENLNGSSIVGAIGFCFYNDKFVIVHAKDTWGPPGGAVEKGESFSEALIREIKEETNMEVLHQEYIGYQDIINFERNSTGRQSISFCVVRPFGEFVSDPDHDITEIKLIDPSEFNSYIKEWGEAGDHVLKRSLEMLENYNSNQ